MVPLNTILSQLQPPKLSHSRYLPVSFLVFKLTELEDTFVYIYILVVFWSSEHAHDIQTPLCHLVTCTDIEGSSEFHTKVAAQQNIPSVSYEVANPEGRAV